MPHVNVDFSDVEEFEAVPVGDYVVEITEAEAKQSSTGKAMLTLQLTVKEPDEFEGRKLFDNLMLEGNALWRTKRALESIMGDELPKGAYGLDTNELIGIQCGVYVTQRVWKKEDGGDGSVQADVRRYTSLDEMEFDEDIDDMFG